MAADQDYSVMFRRDSSSLWPPHDDDNDVIPNVLVAFDLWELANLEVGGPFPRRGTTFTKITSGTPQIPLIHDENIDLGTDPVSGQPVYGIADVISFIDPSTGVLLGGSITWDNADVTLVEFFKKVSLHEIGHFMGLGHGASFGADSSVMNNARGYQDALGQISQVVTVCDRDIAAQAATRTWPIP